MYEKKLVLVLRIFAVFEELREELRLRAAQYVLKVLNEDCGEITRHLTLKALSSWWCRARLKELKR